MPSGKWTGRRILMLLTALFGEDSDVARLMADLLLATEPLKRVGGTTPLRTDFKLDGKTYRFEGTVTRTK